jgi:hypothetical protein
MSFQHQNLASGRWQKLTLVKQMANVGSEVERAISWRKKGDKDYSRKAFERSLELLDLILMDPENKKRLKEPCRIRELLVDYFAGENQYSSTDDFWRKYFYPFYYAARK